MAPRGTASLARDLAALVRPQQWYKNLLVFVGLVFSLGLFEAELLARTTAAFFVFCVLAGGVYVVNDVLDAAEDRLHPRKRLRPVAAGRIGRVAALAFGLTLLALGLVAAESIHPQFFAVAAAYVVLQLAYVAYLKHHVFLDLFTIATGLMLRAAGGAVLIGVGMSPWLVLCTFFLALFLGLGKRRNELAVMGEAAGRHRRNLMQYSPDLLQQATTVVTSALVVSYSLYAFFHAQPLMMLTIPFALYGLFRYLFLTGAGTEGGEPEALLADRPMLANLLLWAALVVVILYRGADLARLWDALGGPP